ncbi:macro domain-containing protein [Photobacterium sp. SDRW27]|uniref:macro domain-containing protein n=1 Tax=Photobacterium obscurum TaxID=2829490 RepID=UPI002243935C|nr:macro domain-containing protein [Photobacterium obscurum]MCW8329261.1 macro domain-containing protein [Photobacterium obscurum]
MHTSIDINEYKQAIRLNQETNIEPVHDLYAAIISALKQMNISVPADISETEALEKLHGTLALIGPYQLTAGLMNQIEAIAVRVNSQRLLVDAKTLPFIRNIYTSTYPAQDRTSIWVGDITQLKADAIVNAANSYLLGCRLPNHACIDNVIHSAAGPRLRDDCATIIDKQGCKEPLGSAKITRGYALPAKYVIHTVGPCLMPGHLPSIEQKQQLINAYCACLNIAAEVDDIKTIAFCAISTGVFSYPKIDAAQLALTTVADWLANHPKRFEKIIFNLYTQADATIYEKLIYEWT